jgi:hypothetical protein
VNLLSNINQINISQYSVIVNLLSNICLINNINQYYGIVNTFSNIRPINNIRRHTNGNRLSRMSQTAIYQYRRYLFNSTSLMNITDLSKACEWRTKRRARLAVNPSMKLMIWSADRKASGRLDHRHSIPTMPYRMLTNPAPLRCK